MPTGNWSLTLPTAAFLSSGLIGTGESQSLSISTRSIHGKKPNRRKNTLQLVLPAEQSRDEPAAAEPRSKLSQQEKPVVGTHQSYQEIGLLASSSGTTSRHHPAQGARCGQQGGKWRWLDEGLPIPSKRKRDVGRGRQAEPTYCCSTAAEKRKRRGWRLASRG